MPIQLLVWSAEAGSETPLKRRSEISVGQARVGLLQQLRLRSCGGDDHQDWTMQPLLGLNEVDMNIYPQAEIPHVSDACMNSMYAQHG